MFAGSAFSEVPFSSYSSPTVYAAVTGVEATGAVGTVSVDAGAIISVTNVYAAGVTGSVVVTGTANVFPTGVIGYGAIGNVNIWQLIPTVQAANWVPVNT